MFNLLLALVYKLQIFTEEERVESRAETLDLRPRFTKKKISALKTRFFSILKVKGVLRFAGIARCRLHYFGRQDFLKERP